MARFFRRGISKVKFLPAVAGTSPTRSEITAGTDLSPAVAAINGFSLNNSPITTPDLNSGFDSQINGPDAAADSSLTLYDDDTTSAMRTALQKGVTGFIVLFPYGDVATKRCEKWPVTSTGYNDQWSLDATAAQAQVGFAVTSIPVQNGVTPA